MVEDADESVVDVQPVHHKAPAPEEPADPAPEERADQPAMPPAPEKQAAPPAIPTPEKQAVSLVPVTEPPVSQATVQLEDDNEDDFFVRDDLVAQDEINLGKYLASQGFHMTESSRQARDGNCWANAISYALSHQLKQQLTAEKVRIMAVEELRV